jgi:uncharacterized paraquat-inducible protein A
MAKKTRAEKREEERKILEEMSEVMPAPKYTGGNKKKKYTNEYDETMPKKIHCKHCQTLMENGVCPNCGHTVYVPMSKKKREKTRLIVAALLMVGAVILFVALQFKNS